MPVTLNTRKPVGHLSLADFVAFPIWEYADDDEEGLEGQDETWVRPVVTSVVARQTYTHAAADFVASCGRILSGYVTVSTLEGPPDVCQGTIFHDGESLFVSDPEACGFEASRKALQKALGLTEPELFPLAFRLRVTVEGESGPVHGFLP